MCFKMVYSSPKNAKSRLRQSIVFVYNLPPNFWISWNIRCFAHFQTFYACQTIHNYLNRCGNPINLSLFCLFSLNSDHLENLTPIQMVNYPFIILSFISILQNTAYNKRNNIRIKTNWCILNSPINESGFSLSSLEGVYLYFHILSLKIL